MGFKRDTLNKIPRGSMSKSERKQIAKDRWAQMDTVQREPWVQMEEEEKKAYAHAKWCSEVAECGDWKSKKKTKSAAKVNTTKCSTGKKRKRSDSDIAIEEATPKRKKARVE